MRPTWIVLGLVVGLGTVAYVKLREHTGAAPLARTAEQGGAPVGNGNGSDDLAGGAAGAKAGDAAGKAPAATPPLAAPAAGVPEASAEEVRAAALRTQIRAKREANDPAGATALEKQLDQELGDTDEAKRQALERGWALARVALPSEKPLETRLPAAERGRRELSRGLFLREMFDAQGQPTDERRKLVQAIATLNTVVLTAKPSVEGVTRPYAVQAGDSPIRIVSRQKLPYGPNALLFWNYGGTLDAARLRAGDVLLLPVETLELRVNLSHHLLGLYLGGVLVKEFGVGTGKAATPTHAGIYEIRDKYLNPDWHVPANLVSTVGAAVIPYGDKRNELGDAWIPISSPEHPTGFGIHGTIKPETVGTDCSNGCVRLRNPEAVELTQWVRTSKGEGQATRVVVH